MAGVLKDLGVVIAAGRPVRLRRYEAAHLPDPGECVDSLIAVNDRSRPGSARPYFSDGSSWLDCGPPVPASPAPVTVDVTPLVRDAVAELLPRLTAAAMPDPPRLTSAAIPTPAAVQVADAGDDVRTIAGHLLHVVETVNDLAHRLAEAEARVAFLENAAVATVEIKGAAARSRRRARRTRRWPSATSP